MRHEPEPLPPACPKLAEEGFARYKAKGKVLALEVTEEHIDTHFPENHFIAPWGEPMRVNPGDMLCVPLDDSHQVVEQIYRIDRQAFHQTYAPDH